MQSKSFNKIAIGSILLFIFFSCSKDNDNGITTSASPNILLIIADDVGRDASPGYDEGSTKPNMPNVQQLINSGLTFRNFWAYPTCSPTRASIITGKYGYRTNVLVANDPLSTSETTLQQYISDQTGHKYATALIGKWHLSGDDINVNPEDQGIDYYAGLIRGGVMSYNRWQLSEDGQSSVQTSYITEKFTDLAIDWVRQQTKPWFLWLAYTAAHTPFHLPPSEMHSQGDLPDDSASIDANPLPYFMAMIESMDYQIGRFLDSLSQDELNNTVIIYIGDNGTTGQVAQDPYKPHRVKGTIYQGGINTPMYISGYGVSKTGYEDALINSTDLFATIASIAGVDVEKINDSRNFKSLLTSESGDTRDYVYSENYFNNENSWCIGNAQYKLLEFENGNKEMYDLQSDPYENSDLLMGNLSTEQQDAKSQLEAELEIIRN